jgi:hypothetical protein
MLSEKEVSTLIKADRNKKRVSWIDKKDDGKINEDFIEVHSAATPCKKELDEAIIKLIVDEDYSEVEAASIVGKPVTPSGQVIYNDPTFYKSREHIENRPSLEKEKNEGNRYSFFSMENLGLGVTALAVAATIGFVTHKMR